MKLNKKLVSLFALLLAVVMVFSACGEKATTDTSSDAVVDNQDTESEEQTSSEEDKTEDTSSKKTGSTTSKNTSKTTSKNTSKTTSKATTTTTGATTWGSNPYANIPASVKEKGVHVLMWREYTPSEKQQVEDFQKKTGIKVRTTVTTENDYSTKLISLISGKDSPDVASVSVRNFPQQVVKSMQVLDKNEFRLDDSIWYKDYMDCYKVGNNYYSVAINGIWSSEDSNYVTYYSPRLLKSVGVSKTPYQLYKEGNWNFDTQKDIIDKLVNAGKFGMTMQSYDLYALAAGADLAEYNPAKATFTNNLENSSKTAALVSAWTKYQEMARSNTNAVRNWDLVNFQQGNIGLFSAIAYGLYNQGDYFDNMDYKELEAVPVAGPKGQTAYIPSRPKCWGVPKGAKNPEGAAYFLRYYLDPSTINMSSTFYNKQFETIYNTITSKNAKKRVVIGWGIANYRTDSTYTKIMDELAAGNVGSATTTLNKYKNVIKSAVTAANKDLARVVAKNK